MTGQTTAAIVVAAGRGMRTGGDVAKQFLPLGGRPVWRWSLDVFAAHPRIDHIVLVVPFAARDALAIEIGDTASVVVGGTSRVESVLAGIAATDCSRVLVHDAARPGVDSAVIDRLLAVLDAGSAAVPILPVADTLAARDGHRLGAVTDRDALARVQTPQAFDRHALLSAIQAWREIEPPTDEAQALRANGGTVETVAGDVRLDKITYPGDLVRIAALVCGRVRTAVGMGYDVHRLVAGEELWLGGVRIPHAFGLAGHSDADVALHALTDALLGTTGDGDIGTHFPPSDMQWRGAASDRFLAHAAGSIAARGGRIAHVDVTIVCETPKIGPYRAAMRNRIAAILDIELAHVSVKATTTERLGFAGRGEGIAAQAVATVEFQEAT